MLLWLPPKSLFFPFILKTAADLNEHIRQIENESKIFEIINMFPNDDLVSCFVTV